MRDLVAAVYDYDITNRRRLWAQSKQRIWGKTELDLRHFNLTELGQLIIHEVNCRRRKYVVKRLLSRYSKLRREDEWSKIERLMEERDARACNRAVSVPTSWEDRGDSD